VARKMLDVIMEEIKIDFEVIGRIGRKEERQRPLRIKLKDMEDRRRVLARAKNLKKADGMQGYYIVPDLTKIQQEEDKKLRNEVRRLREAGNTFARISRGVVVTEARESNSQGAGLVGLDNNVDDKILTYNGIRFITERDHTIVSTKENDSFVGVANSNNIGSSNSKTDKESPF